MVVGEENQPLLRDCAAEEALALLNAGERVEVITQHPGRVQVRAGGNQVGNVTGTLAS